MAQNRKPPAYQEYSSEILANRHFRQMSLAERGLLYTLRLECWTNFTVPSKKDELAKYLGLTIDELTDAYKTRLDAFIEVKGDDLRIPEIEDYRQHLNERKEKQSKGGKAGAKITNKKRAETKGYNPGYTPSQGLENASSDPSTHSTGNSSTGITANSQQPHQGSNESLVEFDQVKSRKSKSISNGDALVTKEHQDWANEYDKASNGD